MQARGSCRAHLARKSNDVSAAFSASAPKRTQYPSFSIPRISALLIKVYSTSFGRKNRHYNYPPAIPQSLAMGSHGLTALCLEPSYIATFNILNIPSQVLPDSQQGLASNLSWLASSNITTYTANPPFILDSDFKYSEITSLPLMLPLAIQCPIAACIFPISGYFTFLQRLLIYINIGIATFALHIPLLRGVSQIWLTTFWFSVLAMFAATILTTKETMIYNLDLQPAVLVVHIGFLPTLLWFSFRAEPGEARHASKRDGEEAGVGGVVVVVREGWWKRRRRDFSDYPVTRILVPLYALWGVINIVLANATQDSAGFWPKATAVVLSNGTNYLLTSPCFQDASGFVGLWPPAPSPYNGIRALNDLSIYFPPDGESAVDAMQAVPRIDFPLLHVGSVVICFVIIMLSFIKLSWLEGVLRSWYVMRNLAPHTVQKQLIFAGLKMNGATGALFGPSLSSLTLCLSC